MEAKTNKERLLRAIRALQLLQRNTTPSSSLGKAVGKALAPLLKEAAAMPDPVLEPPPAA